MAKSFGPFLSKMKRKADGSFLLEVSTRADFIYLLLIMLHWKWITGYAIAVSEHSFWWPRHFLCFLENLGDDRTGIKRKWRSGNPCPPLATELWKFGLLHSLSITFSCFNWITVKVRMRKPLNFLSLYRPRNGDGFQGGIQQH